MKDSTYNIIKMALAGDDSIGDAERDAILACCREPFVAHSMPASTPACERYVRPREAAELLSVSLRTVQRLVKSGALPSKKIVGCRCIPEWAVTAPAGQAPGSQLFALNHPTPSQESTRDERAEAI